jgi:hypothetical protein
MAAVGQGSAPAARTRLATKLDFCSLTFTAIKSAIIDFLLLYIRAMR